MGGELLGARGSSCWVLRRVRYTVCCVLVESAGEGAGKEHTWGAKAATRPGFLEVRSVPLSAPCTATKLTPDRSSSFFLVGVFFTSSSPMMRWLTEASFPGEWVLKSARDRGLRDDVSCSVSM